MKNVLHYKGYSAKPEYSAEDQVFYGKILGIDDLVDFYTENAKELEQEFHAAVDDYLAFCQEVGKQPQKEFSGTFNVRISPELHRKTFRKAQEDGIALNKVVENALTEYLSPAWHENRTVILPEEMAKMYSAEEQTVDTAPDDASHLALWKRNWTVVNGRTEMKKRC